MSGERQTEVWMWGRTMRNRGSDSPDQSIQPPARCEMFDRHNIVQVACGSDHAVAISRRGDVFSWGSGQMFQLGHGDVQQHASAKPIRALTLARALAGQLIVSVRCGSGFTVALAEQGDVFSWGRGDEGQTGHGELIDQSVPKCIETLTHHHIHTIACGGSHSLAVDVEGQVFAWGRGRDGRLGIGGHVLRATPVAVGLLQGHRVVKVECGWSHSVAVTDTGEVFSWGKGSMGQLGLGNTESQTTPQRVVSLTGVFITDVSCGYHHTVLMSNLGALFVCGGGDGGGLGLGQGVTTAAIPTALTLPGDAHCVAFSCGLFHTVALCVSKAEEPGGGGREDEAVRAVEPDVDSSDEDNDNDNEGGDGVGEGHDGGEGGEDKHEEGPVAAEEIGNGALARVEEAEHGEPNNREGDEHEGRNGAAARPGRGVDANARHRSSSMSGQLVGKSGPGHVMQMVAWGLNSCGQLGLDRESFPQVDTPMLVDVVPPGREVLQVVCAREFSVAILVTSKNAKLRRRPQGHKRIPSEAVTELLSMRSLNPNEVHSVVDPKHMQRWNDALSQRDAHAAVRAASMQPLWRAGVPFAIRGRVWRAAIGNPGRVREGLYRELVARARASARHNLKTYGFESSIELIDNDMPRTLPDLELFDQHGAFVKQLRRVLYAWAFYRPDVGYVQGMSYMAGMILLHVQDTYAAFEMFANIMTHLHLFTLFRMELASVRDKLHELFEQMLQANLPQVHSKFEALGVRTDQYLPKWLLSLFVQHFSDRLEIASRVWDRFVMEGFVSLLQVSVGVLSAGQATILEATDLMDCNPVFRKLPRSLTASELFAAVDAVKVPDGLVAAIATLRAESLEFIV